MAINKIVLNEESFYDLKYIASGVFYPLKGFMGYEEYLSVVEKMRLLSGEIWTLPITLEVDNLESYRLGDRVDLVYKEQIVGYIDVESKFKVSSGEIYKVFGTQDIQHPGVKKEFSRSPYRVGGKVFVEHKYLENTLHRGYITEVFKWKNPSVKSIAGFQTRNPIHRAHEHLQRVALEICDALFINPLVGWKKVGDFSESAVMTAYKTMLDSFYPKDRTHLEGLKTQMRYAGPREAIFHAIIRRNLGCTHFIIGRDHAGVGDYYGIYEAQDLARKISSQQDLGITLLLLREPYYCEICQEIVSDKTCKHYEKARIAVSGTAIREALKRGETPNVTMMRQEISHAIIGLGRENIFIKE